MSQPVLMKVEKQQKDKGKALESLSLPASMVPYVDIYDFQNAIGNQAFCQWVKAEDNVNDLLIQQNLEKYTDAIVKKIDEDDGFKVALQAVLLAKKYGVLRQLAEKLQKKPHIRDGTYFDALDHLLWARGSKKIRDLIMADFNEVDARRETSNLIVNMTEDEKLFAAAKFGCPEIPEETLKQFVLGLPFLVAFVIASRSLGRGAAGVIGAPFTVKQAFDTKRQLDNYLEIAKGAQNEVDLKFAGDEFKKAISTIILIASFLGLDLKRAVGKTKATSSPEKPEAAGLLDKLKRKFIVRILGSILRAGDVFGTAAHGERSSPIATEILLRNSRILRRAIVPVMEKPKAPLSSKLESTDLPTSTQNLGETTAPKGYGSIMAVSSASASKLQPFVSVITPEKYPTVVLIDVTEAQFESLLAELELSTPMGKELAYRVKAGQLHMTIESYDPTSSYAGLALPKENLVQWQDSIFETASKCIHEYTHNLDSKLASSNGPRTEIEARARLYEYEYRALRKLDPYDETESIYREILKDAQKKGLPFEQALKRAFDAMIDMMQTDPQRYGVEPAAKIVTGNTAKQPSFAPTTVKPTFEGPRDTAEAIQDLASAVRSETKTTRAKKSTVITEGQLISETGFAQEALVVARFADALKKSNMSFTIYRTAKPARPEYVPEWYKEQFKAMPQEFQSLFKGEGPDTIAISRQSKTIIVFDSTAKPKLSHISSTKAKAQIIANRYPGFEVYFLEGFWESETGEPFFLSPKKVYPSGKK